MVGKWAWAVSVALSCMASGVAADQVDPAVITWLLTRSVPEEEPIDFDFTNFKTVPLTFTVPDDLIEADPATVQIDLKIYATWDSGQAQDLFVGRGAPGAPKTVDLNLPTAVYAVTIEYFAFDLATGNFAVRAVSVAL